MQYKFVSKSVLAVLIFLIGFTSVSAKEVTIEQLRQWNSHNLYNVKKLSDKELLEFANSSYSCYVVPHTHWDKEWAFSFEQHHLRLIKLVDNTIDILENNPDYKCFVLDGQSSLIADYLADRPEMADRVKSLAQSGRLLLGPWYTQGDMLISSGEEIVRNLMIGMRTAQDAGGVMKHGHTADNFGYCAQTPQIYRGFGIESASLYRGPDAGADYYKSVFKWSGLDGSPVHVANLMGPSGYLMFTWLFDVPELPESLLLRALPYYTPYAVTDQLLCPAGSDATEPGADLPDVLKRLKSEFPKMDFRIANFNEYINDVLARNPQIPDYTGGLRLGHACTGCISAHLDLKRQNAKAYTTLESFAEPFSALAWLVAGRRYPATSLERSWKYLFENLSHDSMAGYSIDPVHQINESRNFEANRLAEMLAIRGMKTLVEKIKTPDKSDILRKPLVVFNSLPWPRTDVVETWLSTTARGKWNDPFKEGQYKSYKVVDLDGHHIPAHIDGHGGEMFRIRFLANDVPALGYKTFLLEAIKEEPTTVPLETSRVLENQLVKLTFHKNGCFDLLDKETGLEYPGLYYFENQQIPGSSALGCRFSDEITTSINQTADIELVEDTPINKTIRVQLKNWMIPSSPGSSEMVPMPVTSYITLTKGKKRVDVYTEIENSSVLHLVRAVFPTPAQVDSFTMGVQFGAQKAPVYDRQNPPGGPWSHEIYPHLDWCDVSEGKQGLAILDRGTPVVSVYPDYDATGKTKIGTKIMLPMFRATQNNNADIRPSIPKSRFSSAKSSQSGQLLGVQRISFSIFPHKGNWQEAKVYKQSLNFATRLWPETITINDVAKWMIGPYGFPQTYVYPEGDMPGQQSFLSVETEGVLLSAFKKAEKGDAIIVRFYNTTGQTKNAKLNFFRKAKDVKAVNMNEEGADGLPEVTWQINKTGQTCMQVPMRPFQIVTIRLDVNAPPEKRWFQTSY